MDTVTAGQPRRPWRWMPLIGYVLLLASVVLNLHQTQATAYAACQQRNQVEMTARATFLKMAELEENETDYPVPTPGAREFRQARGRLFRERANSEPLPSCRPPLLGTWGD
jgi:hypothetical protein